MPPYLTMTTASGKDANRLALAPVFLYALASVDNPGRGEYPPSDRSRTYRLLIHDVLEKRAGKVEMNWLEIIEREEKLFKLYQNRR